jgi:flagellin
LEQALTRLSTGLRINTGKDDPAGLIASENLRSDITSIKRAIGNTDRANQVIATADSALGQVSSLLNDIRGLVTEAANSGALSADQVAANQLQIDSSLEALNRIAQTVTFQGRKLLDGSLSFTTTAGTGYSTVSDLQIDQANLGTAGSQAVEVVISTAADVAEVTNPSGFSAATNATAVVKFAPELYFDNTNFASNAELFIQAKTPGASLEGVTVQFVGQTGLGAGNETAVNDEGAGTLTITVDDTAATTAANIVDAINEQVAEFHATANGQGAQAVTAAEAIALSGNTVADFLTLTAATAGPDLNNVEIEIIADAGVAAGAPTADYDSDSKKLTIRVNNAANTTLANIDTAITTDGTFTATVSATAADESLNIAAGNLADFSATGNTGTTGGGVLLDDLVFELSGKKGSEVFTFDNGTDINQLRDAINLVSDATGVSASVTGTLLTLASTEYGSDAFVDVNVISEGSSGTFEAGLSAPRATGSDIVAKVNGVSANGKGNTLSINTSTLDLTATVAAGSSQDFSFTITGGGALFQLGPDVVSNQQARIGITSVNTARLGGGSGKLYELGSGGTADLATDPTTAALIIEEAINQVTSLRGRLGAFQRTSLETNKSTLNDTLVNLTEAESQIRDADFAAETAALTRAQILVQSGTTVLAVANQNPQNVLALLR